MNSRVNSHIKSRVDFYTTYRDRVKGLIFGAALADSLGAYFEFRTESQILRDYPYRHHSVNFPPEKGASFMRRGPKQHWTDDTSQMILLMETLIQTKENKFDVYLFADKLFDWMEHGFPEFGETKGMGVGGYTQAVLTHEYFLDDPLWVSQEMARSSGNASNGSLMRTAIMAARDPSLSRKKVLKDAMISGRVTHYNSKCTKAIKIYTDIVWSVLHDKEPFFLPDNLYQDIEEMVLDDTHMGFVGKTLRVAVWAYFHMDEDFKDVIKTIVLKGGDADTNACVAGAILGARVGFSALPQDWIAKMAHGKWLEKMAEMYLDSILGNKGKAIYQQPQPVETDRDVDREIGEIATNIPTNPEYEQDLEQNFEQKLEETLDQELLQMDRESVHDEEHTVIGDM